jgi:predicted GIY-YIG superfamily endonuclease
MSVAPPIVNQSADISTLHNQHTTTSWYVYALQCENGKYYVGRTYKPVAKRFQEHVEGKDNAAAWTIKHKPIAVLHERKCDNKYQEDALLFEMMEKYGVENVRGGTYSQTVLTTEQRTELRKKFDSVNDRCYECGKVGHFANDCPAKSTSRQKESNAIQSSHSSRLASFSASSQKHQPGTTPTDSFNKQAPVPYRGSSIKRFAKNHKPTSSSSLLKKPKHSIRDQMSTKASSTTNCYRCGRQGHYSTDCFAKAHANGHKLPPVDINKRHQ